MTTDFYSGRAVYVGSFDPLTLGHLDIITRGSMIFDSLVIGIGINPDKKPLFSVDERLELCRNAVSHLKNVDVTSFHGLAVEFVRESRSRILLRGVRSLTDIDAEFTMSFANRVLDDEIESVFLTSSEQYSHISSSLIKQIARMASGDVRERLKEFLPEAIIEPVVARVEAGN